MNEDIRIDIGCHLGYDPVVKSCDAYSQACGALSIGKALEDKTAAHCKRRSEITSLHPLASPQVASLPAAASPAGSRLWSCEQLLACWFAWHEGA